LAHGIIYLGIFRLGHRITGNDEDIPTWLDQADLRPNNFAESSFDPVSFRRIAKSLADQKSKTAESVSIGSNNKYR
jgi:hypothetical protein